MADLVKCKVPPLPCPDSSGGQQSWETGRSVQFREGFQTHPLHPSGAQEKRRAQGWGGGWKVSPGRGPSQSHHVPAVRLRPGRCGSLQCQRGSAQGERRCQPSRGCRGGSRRAGARGPRRGTPGSGGPETAAAPRPAPVPGQHAPGGAAAASRGQRGRGPATRPCPRARPRPPELAPSSAPTAASCPSAAHLPGHHLRRRRRRRCSYRQISRDFAPPRAHPPPTRTRRARTPAWKLQEAPCGPRGLHDLLLFSHPASTRAGGPEELKPRWRNQESRK